MNDKIVCEISGGADSMLATLLAKEKYKDSELYGIIVNYGQLTFDKEFKKALNFCSREKINLKKIDILNLFDCGTIVGEDKMLNEEISDIYTPLRNVVLLSCSSSYAENIKAHKIIVGSRNLNYGSGEITLFKDTTLSFYKMFESMLYYTSYEKIEIEPILMSNRNNKMMKKEVYYELLKRKYMYDDFYNCYNNKDNYLDCNCNNCNEMKLIKHEILF